MGSQPSGSTDDGPTHPRVHRALTSNLKEIRLVNVHPSTDFSSTIECHLIHTTLNSSREYEALSYVWGKPDFTQQIVLDDEPFYITANLDIALRYLRRTHTDRLLWVDAICINQSDTSERNEQVGHMAEIYSRCAVDLFWLGEPDNEVKRGMDIMRTLEGFDITKLQTLGWEENVPFSREEGQGQAPDWTIPRNDLRALRKVFVEPKIWQRVWVVQEISFAPKTLLVSGNDELGWDAVDAFLGAGKYYTDAFHSPFVHGSGAYIKTTFTNAQIVKNQREAVREMQQGGESKLLDVLARFRTTKSTDPRDKVYALLGLVSDHLGLEVDYRKTAREVYIDVVRCLINASANLDILCQSQWAVLNNPDRDQTLPSWVPDFNAPGKGSFLFAQRDIFNAGDPQCSTPCQISHAGRLSLTGVSLGCISQLPGVDFRTFSRCEKGFSSKTYSIMRSWMPRHLTNLESSKGETPTQPYLPTGEDSLYAFWRTLAVDCKAYPMTRLTPEEIMHDVALAIHLHEAVKDESLDISHSRFIADKLKEMVSWNVVYDTARKWRFAISEKGHYAMVPFETQEGDVLAVLPGAKVPFILRPVTAAEGENSESSFSIVGGSYVHGFMDGEVRAGVERQELKDCTFVLV